MDINSEKFPKELSEKITVILDSKKARDIKVLRVEDKTILANYFVICCGSSTTQVRSLSGEIEEKLREEDMLEPLHSEGYNEGTWAILDYGCVIVHIFNRETREFYKLDKLWADAEEIDISSLLVD